MGSPTHSRQISPTHSRQSTNVELVMTPPSPELPEPSEREQASEGGFFDKAPSSLSSRVQTPERSSSSMAMSLIRSHVEKESEREDAAI